MTFLGSNAPRGILDRIRAGILARPVILRVRREHFEDARQRAEARAVRSRVFSDEVPVSDPREP